MSKRLWTFSQAARNQAVARNFRDLRQRAEAAEAERDELRKRIAYLADVFTLPGSAAEAGRQALIDNGFVLLYDAIAYVCRIVDPSVTGAPFAALDDQAGGSDG